MLATFKPNTCTVYDSLVPAQIQHNPCMETCWWPPVSHLFFFLSPVILSLLTLICILHLFPCYPFIFPFLVLLYLLDYYWPAAWAWHQHTSPSSWQHPQLAAGPCTAVSTTDLQLEPDISTLLLHLGSIHSWQLVPVLLYLLTCSLILTSAHFSFILAASSAGSWSLNSSILDSVSCRIPCKQLNKLLIL